MTEEEISFSVVPNMNFDDYLINKCESSVGNGPTVSIQYLDMLTIAKCGVFADAVTLALSDTCTSRATAYEDPLNYKISMMMGVDKSDDNYVLWFNDQPYHAGISMMLSFQRMMFEKATGKRLYLEVTSHPRDGSRYEQDTIRKLFWGKSQL